MPFNFFKILGFDRFRTRVWAILSLVYLASAVVIVITLFNGYQKEIIESAALDMAHRTELAANYLRANIRSTQLHAALLASSPQVISTAEGIRLDQQNKGSKDATKALFNAFMRTYPEYFQVRVLDGSSGNEYIRLNRKGDTLEVVADSSLQNKSDRPYFLHAQKLGSGQYYVSGFDLNQEHGQLSIPYIKTIRVATPISLGSSGIPSAVLVLNVNAKHWFEGVAEFSGVKDSVYVLDSSGRFLLHPYDDKSFLDLKPKNDLELSELDLALIDRTNVLQDTLTQFEGEQGQRLVYSRQASLDVSIGDPFTVATVVSKNALFGEARKEIRTTITMLLVAMAAGVLVLMWLSEQIVRPIKDLAEKVRAFIPGQDLPQLTVYRNDEVGTLANSFELLAEKINEQLGQLRMAKVEAEKASEAKDLFLSSFSHEMRTPLNSISGMTEVLRQKEKNKEHEPIIQTLMYSVDHLTAMINDVLDYKRILDGEITLSPRPMVPEEMARNVCMGHMLKAKAKGIALSYKVDPMVPERIISDKVRLTQIVHNLLSNALKFTSKGSISLELGWKDEQLQIKVEDTGSGMDHAELEQIFEEYHQTEHGRREGTGIGLGLAIVKHLTGLMGGNIEVASETQRGSRFTITIPVEMAEDPMLDSSRPPDSSNVNVLYVDDIEVNRTTMDHILGLWGIQIRSVGSCREALPILESDKIDVLLMDLRMPEMDGFECIKAIADLGVDLPIIAVSAELGEGEKDRLAAMGVHRTIEKPVDPTLLAAAITEIQDSSGIDVYTDLLNNYCNHDQDLLSKLQDSFEKLLKESLSLIESHEGNKKDDAALLKLLTDIRHKLMPSMKMFGQESVLEQMDKGATLKSFKDGIHSTLNFLESFGKSGQ